MKAFRRVPLWLLMLFLMALVSPVFAQTTELQVTWWGSQNRHDRTIQVIEMYEAANPNIDIVYTFASFDEYWVRVNTEAAGGNLACVMQHDYAYLSEWANRGLLAPLDPFVEQGIIDLSNVDDSYIAGGRVNDQLYGLSLGTNSQSIIIDVDAFEAAGVELPPADWTWADFEATALALHEATGTWAYGAPTLGDDQLWTSLMLAHGFSPFNETGTALGYSDDQPLVDYFSMILRLQEAGAIATPEEIAQIQTGPENSPIVTGDAAMQYQWSNQVVAIFNAAGQDRNLRLWHLPRPEGGSPANYLKPSMFFSIPASCEQQEEAARFINFFVNDLAAADILQSERGVPISSAVREHLSTTLSPVDAETFGFLTRVEADSSPIFPPNPPGYNDLRNNIWNPLIRDPILYGQLGVEEGIQMFRSEAEALLSENS